ncbi:MAG: hypothetical protein WDN31_12660 [Hyphomicrobium sp.]
MEFSATRLQTTARRALAHRPPFHAPTRHALLQAHGKAQCPSIRSLSRRGIRLDGAFGLHPGDAITVKLPSQQTVGGTIEWSVAGFCGVVFTVL